MSSQRTWLWPDRTIGKRESRDLREEHNALVKLNVELLAVLELVERDSTDSDVLDYVRAAIAKAKGDA